MDRLGEDEGGFLLDIRHRPVGREPDGKVLAAERDVVAADRAIGDRRSIVAGRTHPDGDARQPGHRLDDADELRRAEHTAELTKARREIGDLDRSALAVGQHGRHQRRVALVVRSKVGQVIQDHVGESLLLVARHETGEDGIAIEPRVAPPDEARRRFEQRGGLPVTDDGEIESEIRHVSFPFQLHTSRSQDRTC